MRHFVADCRAKVLKLRKTLLGYDLRASGVLAAVPYIHDMRLGLVIAAVQGRAANELLDDFPLMTSLLQPPVGLFRGRPAANWLVIRLAVAGFERCG